MNEMPSAYNHTIRTAKKDHKCCECYGAIKKGEQYHYHSGVWSGEGASYKVCMDCEELRSELSRRDEPQWGESPAFADLVEYLGNGDHFDLRKRFAEISLRRGVQMKEWLQRWIDNG